MNISLSSCRLNNLSSGRSNILSGNWSIRLSIDWSNILSVNWSNILTLIRSTVNSHWLFLIITSGLWGVLLIALVYSFIRDGNWSIRLNSSSGILLHVWVSIDNCCVGVVNISYRLWLRVYNMGLYLLWRGVHVGSCWLLEVLYNRLSRFESSSQIWILMNKSSNRIYKHWVMSITTFEISNMLIQSFPIKFSVTFVTVFNSILGTQFQ